MRVSRSIVRRVRAGEDGAVLAMVAISLLVLLGMLVLTFDLGRSVAIRRQMVGGTDAAALAAAQQCALGRGTANAQAAAAQVLAQNEGGASISTFSAPQCDSLGSPGAKPVTVTSSVPVDYYFAPIFGFDSGSVAATATAVWGPAMQTRPIPITVNYTQLQGCSIPATPPPPGSTVHCELTYPRDTLQEPRWGVLDLSNWNDADAAPCHIDASTLRDQIVAGGWPEPLPINDPAAGQEFGLTPDCLDNGLSFSVWDELEGRTLTFPVLHVPTSYGDGCTGEEPDCQIHTANVIDFITLHVTDVVNNGSTVVVQTEWAPIVQPSGLVGGRPVFGDNTIRLVK